MFLRSGRVRLLAGGLAAVLAAGVAVALTQGGAQAHPDLGSYFTETGDTNADSPFNAGKGGWGGVFRLTQSEPESGRGKLQIVFNGPSRGSDARGHTVDIIATPPADSADPAAACCGRRCPLRS
jgi:hypothetical protein